jgi:hypothetical protein
MVKRAQNIANGASAAALIAATLVFLGGCAAQPERARDFTPPSCGGGRVAYCVSSGSRAAEGLCRCISQESAQTALDNL